MVSNTGKNKWFRIQEEKIVSNTGRNNGREHGKKKLYRTWEEKIVSNTERKIVSKRREDKMPTRTLSSTVGAYLHDVFDKKLLPVLLPCACHQVVVQLNKKQCITNNDGN
jgi:hypothetical protein